MSELGMISWGCPPCGIREQAKDNDDATAKAFDHMRHCVYVNYSTVTDLYCGLCGKQLSVGIKGPDHLAFTPYLERHAAECPEARR